MAESAKWPVGPPALDLTLAAVVCLPGLVAAHWSAAGPGSPLPTASALVVCGLTVGMRRWWPLAGPVVGSVAVVLAVATRSLNPDGTSVGAGIITMSLLVWLAAMSFTVGSSPNRVVSLVALPFLLVTPQWGSTLNPFPIILTVGPWLIGRVVRSQYRLLEALDSRASALAAERDRYAAEAVRLDQARLARELHDIVAHNLSVIVIQAAAGQGATDPDVVPTTLADIAELANQADADLGGLDRVLAQDPRPLSRETFAQVIAHAENTGATINVTITGDVESIVQPRAAIAYRVLQEGLTNALRHAPGAPIAVSISCADPVEVTVTNFCPPAQDQSLALLGSGHGLDALEQRITSLGGTFDRYRTQRGGWTISARLPGVDTRVAASAGPILSPGADVTPPRYTSRVTTPPARVPTLGTVPPSRPRSW
ncbi:histidine kinase [Lapillicoccus sp.]|uniref:sensor histidine kinase n=1 Tax=Lapillicoccus sp. TaxID=1909287 RepID=UPI003264E234